MVRSTSRRAATESDRLSCQRKSVHKEYKNEELRCKRRRQNMLQAHVRREALKRKAQQERDRLSQLHLVTASEELHQALLRIDTENLSVAKKKAQKLLLLKTQIKIRKKVFGQTIHIVFSHSRKQ